MALPNNLHALQLTNNTVDGFSIHRDLEIRHTCLTMIECKCLYPLFRYAIEQSRAGKEYNGITVSKIKVLCPHINNYHSSGSCNSSINPLPSQLHHANEVIKCEQLCNSDMLKSNLRINIMNSIIHSFADFIMRCTGL